MNTPEFYGMLLPRKKWAWDSFVAVVRVFSGNKKDENYRKDKKPIRQDNDDSSLFKNFSPLLLIHSFTN